MEDRKIFDLATGELCHYPFVLPTRIHYNPDATCPRWEQFLKEITCGDAALETYLKRMVGYCMTDSTVERLMFMLIGNGCNGKSTFINVIQQLMGEYAPRNNNRGLLLNKRDANIENIILSPMQYGRLLILGDLGENETLCISNLKELINESGPITVRPLYSDFIEYIPKFKIICTCNQIPKINKDTKTIWSQIRLLPFEASFAGEKIDKFLMEKLDYELPGIFNWALEGAQEWYEHGLPTAVEE